MPKKNIYIYLKRNCYNQSIFSFFLKKDNIFVQEVLNEYKVIEKIYIVRKDLYFALFNFVFIKEKSITCSKNSI